MTTPRQALGRWGEAHAARYLVRSGYQVLDRNVRTEYGEIDLVARRGTVTVFVEVKTRRSEAFGWPEQAITSRKRSHLLAAAQAYLQRQPHLDGDWRVDVIAIQSGGPGSTIHLRHYENAVA